MMERDRQPAVRGRNQPASNLIWALALELGLGVVGVAVAWFLDLSLAARMQLTPILFAAGVAATLPMLGWLAIAIHSRWKPLVEIRTLLEEILGNFLGDCTLRELALLALAAGLGEELLFRGALQPLLQRWTSPAMALFLASLLFGLAHAMSFTYFVLATLIGWYLGWVMVLSDSLIPPIIAHGLYDYVAIWILRKRIKAEAE
jgi:CAAX protease family protein